MTTSRTGTARWKNLRATTLRQAQADGLTHCPLCATLLDYTNGRQPSSAEVDHLIPASQGGQDTEDNVRVICRHCNQSRGNRPTTTKATPPKVITNIVTW